jgi:hypothetical protein
MPLYTLFTQFAECTGTHCKYNGITKKHSMAAEMNKMRVLYDTGDERQG